MMMMTTTMAMAMIEDDNDDKTAYMGTKITVDIHLICAHGWMDGWIEPKLIFTVL